MFSTEEDYGCLGAYTIVVVLCFMLALVMLFAFSGWLYTRHAQVCRY